jgi:hypothetical protein
MAARTLHRVSSDKRPLDEILDLAVSIAMIEMAIEEAKRPAS